MIIIQEEIVKDLISTNDATIIGILLGIVALMIFWIIRQDKKITEANNYIRASDKETLKILLELTNTLKEGNESGKEVKNLVQETKEIARDVKGHSSDNKNTLNSLMSLIQQKLTRMP